MAAAVEELLSQNQTERIGANPEKVVHNIT